MTTNVARHRLMQRRHMKRRRPVDLVGAIMYDMECLHTRTIRETTRSVECNGTSLGPAVAGFGL